MRALTLLFIAALFATACGPSANASLSGKVAFADGSDAVGLNVSLVGPAAKQVVTAGGGSYNFDKLVPGIYLVSVDALNTREGHLSVAIEVKGKTDAPVLTFNTVGSLKGNVVDSSGNAAANVSVFLTGSDRGTLTDDQGNYAFIDVPSGDYGLSARQVSPPQLASAMVTIKRGDNMGPTLMLADDTNAYGTLKGSMSTFVPGGNGNGLHAIAGGISVNTDPTGAWSLSLPPGNYEVVAGGGAYPDQSLGRFDVRSGEVTTVPNHQMSIYHVIPDPSGVNSANAAVWNDSFAAVLVNNQSQFAQELVLVDLHTFATRLIAAGNTSAHAFSQSGKWLSFRDAAVFGDALIAYNVSTGKMFSMAVPGLDQGPVISSDDAAMVASTYDKLYRMDLATGNVTVFSITGGTGFFMSADRFLYRSVTTSPFDIMQIGSTGQPSTVLQQQTNLSQGLGYGLAGGVYAYQAIWVSQVCMTNCTIQLYTYKSSAPVTVGGPTIVGFPSELYGSTVDWLGFVYTGGRSLVKTSDGSATALPATTTELHFNEDQTRVAFYTAANEVREDSVPPNANAAVAITGTGPFGGAPYGAYLSPTRFMVFVNGVSKRADIRTGTATTDDDVDYAYTVQLFPPGASWVKKTTEAWLATVYDQGNDFPLTGLAAPVNGPYVVGYGSYKDPQGSGLNKYAVISDEANHYVLDGVLGMAKLEAGETIANGYGIIPFPVDRYRLSLVSSSVLRTYDGTRTISYEEPGINLSFGPAYLPAGKVMAAGVVYGVGAQRDHWYIAVTP